MPALRRKPKVRDGKGCRHRQVTEVPQPQRQPRPDRIRLFHPRPRHLGGTELVRLPHDRMNLQCRCGIATYRHGACLHPQGLSTNLVPMHVGSGATNHQLRSESRGPDAGVRRHSKHRVGPARDGGGMEDPSRPLPARWIQSGIPVSRQRCADRFGLDARAVQDHAARVLPAVINLKPRAVVPGACRWPRRPRANGPTAA